MTVRDKVEHELISRHRAAGNKVSKAESGEKRKPVRVGSLGGTGDNLK